MTERAYPGSPYTEYKSDRLKSRLELYEENTDIYNGRFLSVWPDLRPQKDQFKVAVVNFPKQQTDALTNFLFRHDFKVTVDDSKSAEVVTDILKKNRYTALMKKTAHWDSILGDGIHLHRLVDGFPVIEYVHPKHFAGHFSPLDTSKLEGCVFQYDLPDTAANSDKHYVYRQTHTMGFFDEAAELAGEETCLIIHDLWKGQGDDLNKYERVALDTLSNFRPLVKMAQDAKEPGMVLTPEGSVVENTGLDELDVVHFKNAEEPEQCYGHSDYTPSLKSKTRMASEVLTQWNIVRASHSQPKIQLPMKMLQAIKDQKDGKVTIDHELFDMIGVQEGEDAKYIVWDGKLDAAEKELKMLRQEYFAEAQIAAPLVSNSTEGVAGGETGRASVIKLLPTNGLAQTKHQLMEPPIQADIRISQKLWNQAHPEDPITVSEVRIHWSTSMLSDDAELINTTISRVSAGLLSKKTALTVLDGSTEAEAEAELARIEEEQKAATPEALIEEAPLEDNTEDGA